MRPKFSALNWSFPALVVAALSLLGAGLALSWRLNYPWLQTFWQACQSGIQNISAFLPSPLVLIVPLVVIIMLGRAGLTVALQLRYTRRLWRSFMPYRAAPPPDLLSVLSQQNISPADVVFLQLRMPHAFCAGFLRPKIWLTSAMINLLSNEELQAVIAHEAWHLRQRDPLRLLISQTLKSAFFFMPIIRSLAERSELQQEIVADQWAIAQMGNDLPLLQALHKLLTQPDSVLNITSAPINSFGVTETRLRRLLNAPQPAKNAKQSWHWLISLSIMALFISGFMFPTFAGPEITPAHNITPCEIEAVSSSRAPIAFINQ